MGNKIAITFFIKALPLYDFESFRCIVPPRGDMFGKLISLVAVNLNQSMPGHQEFAFFTNQSEFAS